VESYNSQLVDRRDLRDPEALGRAIQEGRRRSPNLTASQVYDQVEPGFKWPRYRDKVTLEVVTKKYPTRDPGQMW
jgi:hypothetical protein